MRIALLISVIVLTLGFSSLAHAEASAGPVGIKPDAATVTTVSKVIGGERVSDFINEEPVYGIDILPPSSPKDNRTCVFCWLFAAVFAGMLYEYGKKLKRYKRVPKKWWQEPIIFAAFIYLLHALIHGFLASDIFLEYYWMILFDELVVAFGFYYYLLWEKKARKKALKKAN